MSYIDIFSLLHIKNMSNPEELLLSQEIKEKNPDFSLPEIRSLSMEQQITLFINSLSNNMKKIYLSKINLIIYLYDKIMNSKSDNKTILEIKDNFSFFKNLIDTLKNIFQKFTEVEKNNGINTITITSGGDGRVVNKLYKGTISGLELIFKGIGILGIPLYFSWKLFAGLL